jgi:hypothetical protein
MDGNTKSAPHVSQAQVEQFLQETILPMSQQLIATGVDAREVDAFIQEYFGSALPIAATTNIPSLPPEDRRARVSLPPAKQFAWWEEALLIAGITIVSPILGVFVALARGLASASGNTLALGPQLSVGAGVGVSLGAGLLATPDYKIGVYGSVGGVAGIVASIGLTAQVTIVRGGLERFTGLSWGVGVSGGEAVVGNAVALLTVTNPPQFFGVTFGAGIGAGIPFEVFVQGQHTWAAG